MNNNSVKSVSASSTKSKASRQSKPRQESYKKKFGDRPHMIIPQEDFIWALDKHNSVKTLFMECWLSDPYGSRWQDLTHSLKPGSFKRAKRILSEKGLFAFRPKKSIRDNRETVGYLILNLHGARRNDYWLNTVVKNDDDNTTKTSEVSNNTSSNSKDHPCSIQDHPCSIQDHPCSIQDHPCSSISSEMPTQQAISDPSETLQERLSNSSKELLETLATEKEVSDRDREIALEEQFTSASLPNENQVQSLHSFHCVPVVPDCLSNEKEKDSLGAACPQTPRGQKGKEITTPTEEILNQEYIPNPQSEEAVVRAVAQNLAIEAQKTTKEYQTTAKEAFARIRAIFDEKKKQKQAKRESNLRGDSPMSLSERQAFEEYKREVETNRKKQAEEKLVDFWDF